MAKSLLRIQARELRSQGKSVKEIAKNLKISKGTVSLWVRDIILTVRQLEILQKRKLKGGELGRIKSAFLQKEKRIKLVETSRQEGIQTFGNLTLREFLIAGIAIYWGEGSKKNREVKFCNSDPKLIKFMICWIKKCFGLKTNDLTCYVGINEIHKSREKVVKNYWSKVTNIPLSQFRKTSFKKVNNKKVYTNFEDHYGTLSVKLLKPSKLYYKIIGEIEGLAENGILFANKSLN